MEIETWWLYSEKTGKGLIRHLYIRTVSDKIMVSVVSKSPTLPNEDELIKAFLNVSENVVSIIINHNNSDNSLILGKKSRERDTYLQCGT